MCRKQKEKIEHRKRTSAVFAMLVYAFTLVPFGAFADNARLQKNGRQSVGMGNTSEHDETFASATYARLEHLRSSSESLLANFRNGA